MSKTKNLLNTLCKDYPPTSPSQNIKISIAANKEAKMPSLSIDFITEYDGKTSEVDQAYVTILDRVQTNLKEYPLPDIGVYIYYNEHKQIASIIFKSILKKEEEEEDYQDLLKELEDFLESVHDEAAIQAYRACAYYWCALESGFKMLSGDIVLDFPLEEE